MSISASIATIDAIQDRGTLEHVAAMGQRLKSGYNEIASLLGISHLTTMIGYGFWPEYVFKDTEGNISLETQSLFQQELVRRGILTRAGMFLCGSHQTSDIDKTLSAFHEAMEVVSAAVKSNKVLDWLDGDVLEPVIRAKQ